MPPKLTKCVCAAEPSDSKESIQCGQCKRWFHEVCIGIPAAELGRINAYYCLLCISKQPSLRITYSTEATKPSTEALLDQVLLRFDSLVFRLDGFCEAFAKLSVRMDTFEQQGVRATEIDTGDTQVPVRIAAIASQVLEEQQSAEKKKLNVVIERLPEECRRGRRSGLGNR